MATGKQSDPLVGWYLTEFDATKDAFLIMKRADFVAILRGATMPVFLGAGEARSALRDAAMSVTPVPITSENPTLPRKPTKGSALNAIKGKVLRLSDA